jgi:hypothetical protein
MKTRKAYLSDVSVEEWAFVARYLTPLNEAASRQRFPLRDVLIGLRACAMW